MLVTEFSISACWNQSFVLLTGKGESYHSGGGTQQLRHYETHKDIEPVEGFTTIQVLVGWSYIEKQKVTLYVVSNRQPYGSYKLSDRTRGRSRFQYTKMKKFKKINTQEIIVTCSRSVSIVWHATSLTVILELPSKRRGTTIRSHNLQGPWRTFLQHLCSISVVITDSCHELSVTSKNNRTCT